MYRIGVDLGGTNIVAGVVDENYNIVGRGSVKTRTPRPTENILEDIKEYMKDNEIENYLYTEVIQHTYIKRDNLLFEEQDGKLYIDKRFIDRNSLILTIKYRIIPERFTTTTPWNTLIDLPYNICSIVPLYLASELYKDDDISMSTAYRNQFEAELDYISSQMVDSLGVEHSRDVGDYYG